MNRRLLDPFKAVALPDNIEEFLDHGKALCMAFNRRGTMLAAGMAGGEIVLWDMETRGVAKILSGPDETDVTSVGWSRCGNFLVAGSMDLMVTVYDVAAGSQELQLSVPSPASHVSLVTEGKAPHTTLVNLMEGPPQLLNWVTGVPQPLPVLGESSSAPDASKQAPPPSSSSLPSDPVPEDGAAATASGFGSSGPVALFSKDACYIFVGGKGLLWVLETESLKIVDVVKLPSTSCRVTQLQLSRSGTLLLASCSDRVLRAYDVALPGKLDPGSSNGASSSSPLCRPGFGAWRRPLRSPNPPPSSSAPPPPLHRQAQQQQQQQQPPLPASAHCARPRSTRTALRRPLWRCAALSCDTEHVIAAAAGKGIHRLYVWTRLYGKLERVLEGPQEGVREVLWHPLRPQFLSLSLTGRIYIWAQACTENWSAFAPDFKELGENTEYVELEDEFDWRTPVSGGGKAESGVGMPDILTLDDEQFFSSDDEEEEPSSHLHHLPVDAGGTPHTARSSSVFTHGDSVMTPPPSANPGTFPTVNTILCEGTQLLLSLPAPPRHLSSILFPFFFIFPSIYASQVAALTPVNGGALEPKPRRVPSHVRSPPAQVIDPEDAAKDEAEEAEEDERSARATAATLANPSLGPEGGALDALKPGPTSTKPDQQRGVRFGSSQQASDLGGSQRVRRESTRRERSPQEEEDDSDDGRVQDEPAERKYSQEPGAERERPGPGRPPKNKQPTTSAHNTASDVSHRQQQQQQQQGQFGDYGGREELAYQQQQQQQRRSFNEPQERGEDVDTDEDYKGERSAAGRKRQSGGAQKGKGGLGPAGQQQQRQVRQQQQQQQYVTVEGPDGGLQQQQQQHQRWPQKAQQQQIQYGGARGGLERESEQEGDGGYSGGGGPGRPRGPGRQGSLGSLADRPSWDEGANGNGGSRREWSDTPQQQQPQQQPQQQQDRRRQDEDHDMGS
ncbi:MAG: hypothetical protein WDW38_008486 [Sanguina aurantia]